MAIVSSDIELKSFTPSKNGIPLTQNINSDISDILFHPSTDSSKRLSEIYQDLDFRKSMYDEAHQERDSTIRNTAQQHLLDLTQHNITDLAIEQEYNQLETRFRELSEQVQTARLDYLAAYPSNIQFIVCKLPKIFHKLPWIAKADEIKNRYIQLYSYYKLLNAQCNELNSLIEEKGDAHYNAIRRADTLFDEQVVFKKQQRDNIDYSDENCSFYNSLPKEKKEQLDESVEIVLAQYEHNERKRLEKELNPQKTAETFQQRMIIIVACQLRGIKNPTSFDDIAPDKYDDIYQEAKEYLSVNGYDEKQIVDDITQTTSAIIAEIYAYAFQKQLERKLLDDLGASVNVPQEFINLKRLFLSRDNKGNTLNEQEFLDRNKIIISCLHQAQILGITDQQTYDEVIGSLLTSEIKRPYYDHSEQKFAIYGALCSSVTSPAIKHSVSEGLTGLFARYDEANQALKYIWRAIDLNDQENLLQSCPDSPVLHKARFESVLYELTQDDGAYVSEILKLVHPDQYQNYLYMQDSKIIITDNLFALLALHNPYLLVKTINSLQTDENKAIYLPNIGTEQQVAVYDIFRKLCLEGINLSEIKDLILSCQDCVQIIDDEHGKRIVFSKEIIDRFSDSQKLNLLYENLRNHHDRGQDKDELKQTENIFLVDQQFFATNELSKEEYAVFATTIELLSYLDIRVTTDLIHELAEKVYDKSGKLVYGFDFLNKIKLLVTDSPHYPPDKIARGLMIRGLNNDEILGFDPDEISSAIVNKGESPENYLLVIDSILLFDSDFSQSVQLLTNLDQYLQVKTADNTNGFTLWISDDFLHIPQTLANQKIWSRDTWHKLLELNQLGLLESDSVDFTRFLQYQEKLQSIGISQPNITEHDRSTKTLTLKDLSDYNHFAKINDIFSREGFFLPKIFEINSFKNEPLTPKQKRELFITINSNQAFDTESLPPSLKAFRHLSEQDGYGDIYSKLLEVNFGKNPDFFDDIAENNQSILITPNGELLINIEQVFNQKSVYSDDISELNLTYNILSNKSLLEQCGFNIQIDYGNKQTEFTDLYQAYHHLSRDIPQLTTPDSKVSIHRFYEAISHGDINLEREGSTIKVKVNSKQCWNLLLNHGRVYEALATNSQHKGTDLVLDMDIPPHLHNGWHDQENNQRLLLQLHEYSSHHDICEYFDISETEIRIKKEAIQKALGNFLTYRGERDWADLEQIPFSVFTNAEVSFETESVKQLLQLGHLVQQQALETKNEDLKKLAFRLMDLNEMLPIVPFVNFDSNPQQNGVTINIAGYFDHLLQGFINDRYDLNVNKRETLKLFFKIIQSESSDSKILFDMGKYHDELIHISKLIDLSKGVSAITDILFQFKSQNITDLISTFRNNFIIEDNLILCKPSIALNLAEQYQYPQTAIGQLKRLKDLGLLNLNNRQTTSVKDSQLWQFLIENEEYNFKSITRRYFYLDSERIAHFDQDKFSQEFTPYLDKHKSALDWQFTITPLFFSDLYNHQKTDSSYARSGLSRVIEHGFVDFENITQEIGRLSDIEKNIPLLSFLATHPSCPPDIIPLHLARILDFRDDELLIVKQVAENAHFQTPENRESLFNFLTLAIKSLDPDHRVAIIKILKHCPFIIEDGEMHPFIIENAERIELLPGDKAIPYLKVLQSMDRTPSLEIQRLKNQLADQLLTSNDPEVDYKSIEAVFVRNNLPDAGKILKIFQILYPPQRMDQLLNENNAELSPVLKDAGSTYGLKRYRIFYNDLLRVHVLSGNPSIRAFAEVLIEGEDLIAKIDQVNGDLDKFNKEEIADLELFLDKIEALYESSLLSRSRNHLQSSYISQRILHLKSILGITPDSNLTITQQITKLFLQPLGVSSIEELLHIMQTAKTTADTNNRQLAEVATAGQLALEDGDLLKGTDVQYLRSILPMGAVSKEFLGGRGADTDATPFDTDLSMILKEDLQGKSTSERFSSAIERSLAKDYGDILFVIKNPKTKSQFQFSQEESKPIYQSGKYEIFKTGVHGERHYGIRTGFPTTEINLIIIKEGVVEKTTVLEDLFRTICDNGFYIPVVNSKGEIIFTPQMYDELVKQNKIDTYSVTTALETYTNPKPVIQGLKSSKYIASLFEADAGSWEGYSIEQHTEMVMGQFDKYFGHRSIPIINNNDFRLILALHDIGKSISVKRTGSTYAQHTYTKEIVPYVLEKLGYKQRQINLFVAIANQDFIGEYLTNRVSLYDTKYQIKEMARLLNVPIAQFLEVITIFHMVDAGSYTKDAGGKESFDKYFIFNDSTNTMDYYPEYKQKYEQLRQNILRSIN